MKKIYLTVLLALIANFTNAQCTINASSSAPYFVRYVEIGMPYPDASSLLLNDQGTGDDGGYADFTSMSWDAAVGTTYDTLLRGQFGATEDPLSKWKMWIDFNKNGSFDDAGEELVSKEGSAYARQNFDLPTATPTGDGAYIMRVAVSDTAFDSACDIVTGEIEDYTVNITGLTILSVADQTIANLAHFPNPVVDRLNLTYEDSISSVSVYSAIGSVIYQNNDPNDSRLSIDTESWNPGLYFVTIRQDNRSQTLKVLKK